MIAITSRIFRISCLVALHACSAADETPSSDGRAEEDETNPSSAMQPDAAEVLPVAQQTALIEERLAATNARDWDRWEALHTPDAIRTAPELDQPLRSAAAMRAAIEALSVSFPDYHLELEQAFGQGEWLAVRLHTTGTMTGPLMLSDGSEVLATGQRIDQDWAALVRFDGDHVAEFHEFYDQLTLMVQLGLIAP
jgi:ketosteroid isomerase-like protein